MFVQRDVSDWLFVATEPAGDAQKLWLEDPTSGARWIYKPRKVNPAWCQGEDWAEKIVAEVANLLHVPTACVELAIRDGASGSISRDLKPRGWTLQPGSAALYDLIQADIPRAGRTGHNLKNIEALLANYDPPPGAKTPTDIDAFGVFCGFLILDALVANSDRHEQNWAVLVPDFGGSRPRLAGSFDHASSLGFNLTDQKRQVIVDGNSMGDWVRKGVARRFEYTRRADIPSLAAVARSAVGMAGPLTRDYWRDRLASVPEAALCEIVKQVPHMSDPARTFAIELLVVNRRRLLDGDQGI